MDFKPHEKLNVIFHNRNAVLTGYFDSACLLFDKKDGGLNIGDIPVLDDYPTGYFCVLFAQLPIEERKQIRLENGTMLLQDCVCSLIADDKPNNPLLKEYVEIIGDDPIDYKAPDEFADSSKYATVKCKCCGKIYKVNRNAGYRSSFFKWSFM